MPVRNGVPMTPHNEAQKGDFAEAVLLPGDPARAEWIAATFFEDARRVNGIRHAYGFTGTYKGMPVSVQTTGIGRASFSIYAHELFAFYGVKRAVRIGTSGGLEEHVRIRDVVVATKARMDFEVAEGAADCLPDEDMLRSAVRQAGEAGFCHHVGAIVSSDTFYHPDSLGRFARARSEGAIACDMETASLYALAGQSGVRALSLLTVVDNLISGEETAMAERQAVFTNMCRLALDVLIDTRRPD